MSLFSLRAIIVGDKIRLIDWLHNKGLLDCQKCNFGTAIVFREQTKQGVKGWLYLTLHPLAHNGDH